MGFFDDAAVDDQEQEVEQTPSFEKKVAYALMSKKTGQYVIMIIVVIIGVIAAGFISRKMKIGGNNY